MPPLCKWEDAVIFLIATLPPALDYGEYGPWLYMVSPLNARKY